MLIDKMTSYEFKKAMFLYSGALREMNTKIQIINEEFALKQKTNPIEHIKSRLKTPESIIAKLVRRGYQPTFENALKYVDDIAGIRIICAFTKDIYILADIINSQSDITVLRVKDYIANPKENGYRSYHMLVDVPVFMSDEMSKARVEIQIRTIAMDFWASLEHKMRYKFESQIPENLNFDLLECAEIVSYLDEKMLLLNNEIEKYKV
ncbi:MAG: GTP pyrophosphokinase family protein [Clostridia bacterium]|nr:GTP pyrophosphokinase family protein [Clostridia bacterium]